MPDTDPIQEAIEQNEAMALEIRKMKQDLEEIKEASTTTTDPGDGAGAGTVAES